MIFDININRGHTAGQAGEVGFLCITSFYSFLDKFDNILLNISLNPNKDMLLCWFLKKIAFETMHKYQFKDQLSSYRARFALLLRMETLVGGVLGPAKMLRFA